MSEELNEISDFYITSDTWFGRPQILEIAKRTQFATVEEMNDQLVKNWNKVVKSSDLVFHLGNFAWEPLTARTILKKLKGKIFFLIGNADEALLEVAEEFENVVILDHQIVELPQFDSVLCHYPLEVWNGKSSGTIHFHGHTVFSHKTDLRVSNRINTCVDFWSYSPIKFSAIKEFVNGKI